MKTLFLGNSHTYMNDMPYLFRTLYHDSFGTGNEAVMLAYSGRSLEWHMKEYMSLRYQLLYGRFDHCIIQQAAHPFPEEGTTMENGKKIIELCRKCGTEPVLFMTWAEKRSPENQQKMIEVFEKLAAETGVKLAPVGLVWQKVQQEYPEIELYFEDGEHASPYGDLLIAMTLCRTLHPADEIVLPDRIIDYQVVWDEYPSASLDDTRFIPCDHETAACIRNAVEEITGTYRYLKQ
ncbi:MAG: hypothetical protein K6G61_13085 [Solobacterium sp.]|nr:hypothetical protein [Solobacterium sp.]